MLALGLSAFGLAWVLQTVPPDPGSGPACSQEDPGCTENLEQVESLESTLRRLESGELDEAAERVANIPGLVPAADTCGMRYSKLLAPAPRPVRNAFAAANLAAEPALKREILEEIAAQNPDLVWRVEHFLGTISLREGLTGEAVEHAKHMLQTSGLAPACQADAAFLKALASTGQTRQAALLAAVEKDPGHFNAWFHLALVSTARLAMTDGTDCAHHATNLLRAVVHLDRLAAIDPQLARLERVSEEYAPPDSPARALLLGMVYERSGRGEEALGIYHNGVEAATGRSCYHAFLLSFRARLKALEAALGNRQ